MLLCHLQKAPEKTAEPGTLKMTRQTANLASFANHMPDVVAIRRHLHRNPEIGLSEFKTSDFIAEQLAAMGYEVTRGLAGTGVVATLSNGDSTRVTS
jgi:hippurate hydrolase